MRITWFLSCMLALLVACGGSEPAQDNNTTHKDSGPSDSGVVADSDAAGEVPDVGPKKLHGVACQEDAECLYGLCYSSPTVTKNQFKICTKPCQGPGSTACADDGDYTCAIFGTSYEETVVAFCVPACSTVDDCKAIDPRYTACGHPVGATKFCYVGD